MRVFPGRGKLFLNDGCSGALMSKKYADYRVMDCLVFLSSATSPELSLNLQIFVWSKFLGREAGNTASVAGIHEYMISIHLYYIQSTIYSESYFCIACHTALLWLDDYPYISDNASIGKKITLIPFNDQNMSLAMVSGFIFQRNVGNSLPLVLWDDFFLNFSRASREEFNFTQNILGVHKTGVCWF